MLLSLTHIVKEDSDGHFSSINQLKSSEIMIIQQFITIQGEIQEKLLFHSNILKVATMHFNEENHSFRFSVPDLNGNRIFIKCIREIPKNSSPKHTPSGFFLITQQQSEFREFLQFQQHKEQRLSFIVQALSCAFQLYSDYGYLQYAKLQVFLWIPNQIQVTSLCSGIQSIISYPSQSYLHSHILPQSIETLSVVNKIQQTIQIIRKHTIALNILGMYQQNIDQLKVGCLMNNICYIIGEMNDKINKIEFLLKDLDAIYSILQSIIKFDNYQLHDSYKSLPSLHLKRITDINYPQSMGFDLKYKYQNCLLLNLVKACEFPFESFVSQVLDESFFYQSNDEQKGNPSLTIKKLLKLFQDFIGQQKVFTYQKIMTDYQQTMEQLCFQIWNSQQLNKVAQQGQIVDFQFKIENDMTIEMIFNDHQKKNQQIQMDRKLFQIEYLENKNCLVVKSSIEKIQMTVDQGDDIVLLQQHLLTQEEFANLFFNDKRQFTIQHSLCTGSKAYLIQSLISMIDQQIIYTVTILEIFNTKISLGRSTKDYRFKLIVPEIMHYLRDYRRQSDELFQKIKSNTNIRFH